MILLLTSTPVHSQLSSNRRITRDLVAAEARKHYVELTLFADLGGGLTLSDSICKLGL
ncbi:MAG: hypothetical protein JWN34_2353 [Bryobacterales bacterium]|nr:hypothetical protein [Bryobacterales bacterium]